MVQKLYGKETGRSTNGKNAWKLTKPAVYELKKKAEQERLRMHRHG